MKVFYGVIYSYQSPSGKFYIGQTTREEKMSASHKGKQAWNKGLKATLEQRVKLSNSHKGLPSGKKGKHLTEEQRNKVSLGLKKYFKNKTTHNARKIICVETNEIFDSIRQASIKMECNNISAVLRGKRNHTKNYHFKYID